MDSLNIVMLGAGLAMLVLALAGGTGILARALNIAARNFSKEERIAFGALSVLFLMSALGLTIF